MNHLWKFRAAYLADGNWLEPAFITFDSKGKIISLERSSTLKVDRHFDSYLLPGFINSHTHSFQFAMAGRGEIANTLDLGKDDFWSWREEMYRLAMSIDPESLHSIAKRCYRSMRSHGMTHAVEFHYLHHQKDGSRYHKKTEMAEQLLSAAETIGISITIVPVYYQQNSLAGNLHPAQKRFIFSSSDEYFDYLQQLNAAAAGYSRATVGCGAHSLRAVGPEICKEIFGNKDLKGPKHIHASEQMSEVTDSQKLLGKPPVQWLVENCEINAQCHLVHATHTTHEELSQLVQANATVVLCPSTEANLGDGFFKLDYFRDIGGKFSLGTDSNVGLSIFEELRWLDYGLRLQNRKRVVLARESELDSSHYLFKQMILSGRGSAGVSHSKSWFSPGDYFDGTLIDPHYPTLLECPAAGRLSTLIYTADSRAIVGSIVSGKHS